VVPVTALVPSPEAVPDPSGFGGREASGDVESWEAESGRSALSVGAPSVSGAFVTMSFVGLPVCDGRVEAVAVARMFAVLLSAVRRDL
jgi:hypothetical protein